MPRRLAAPKGGPINQTPPPFGQTHTSYTPDAIIGEPRAHREIQHQNPTHGAHRAASPFVESQYAPEGWAGNPRRRPAFSTTGGINRPTRK